MQFAVDEILDAARQSGQFKFVKDEVFDENEKYPALVVVERKRELKEVVSTAQVYFSGWRYLVVILIEKKEGYKKLEKIVGDFLIKLFSKNSGGSVFFSLVSEKQYESYISEYNTLVAELVIEATVKSAYI